MKHLREGRTHTTPFFLTFFILVILANYAPSVQAASINDVNCSPHIRIRGNSSAGPLGLTPEKIKSIYNLPQSGGSGTIAVIDAYDYPKIEDDLKTFSNTMNLPDCTAENGCFEKHPMAQNIQADAYWALETALDIQWAHAIAPDAKILLVEAVSDRAADLLAAVDYARKRPDVTAISMGWGSAEFSGETTYNDYFTSEYGAAFFASAGDNETGLQWPSVSSNVIAVGGTSISFSNDLIDETTWSNTCGGLSKYEKQPSYQGVVVPMADAKRAIPDVSYDADPVSGVAVYSSAGYHGQVGWFIAGGTSVGPPQWAAIDSLSRKGLSHTKLYLNGLINSGAYYRDIKTGSNGNCGFFCTAGAGYDYTTGLGSPITVQF